MADVARRAVLGWLLAVAHTKAHMVAATADRMPQSELFPPPLRRWLRPWRNWLRPYHISFHSGGHGVRGSGHGAILQPGRKWWRPWWHGLTYGALSAGYGATWWQPCRVCLRPSFSFMFSSIILFSDSKSAEFCELTVVHKVLPNIESWQLLATAAVE